MMSDLQKNKVERMKRIAYNVEDIKQSMTKKVTGSFDRPANQGMVEA
jgi:hypothetical protein